MAELGKKKKRCYDINPALRYRNSNFRIFTLNRRANGNQNWLFKRALQEDVNYKW